MRQSRVVIVDNYDSYTWNLFQLIWEVAGERPVVVRNDETGADAVLRGGFTHIVISPGPGHPGIPGDFGICAEILRRTDVPCLGVCLGHQGLAEIAGGMVRRAPEIVHGRTSRISHDGTGIFAGLPQDFRAVRYHSLAVAQPLPACLRITALTDDGVVMALEHRDRPLFGVQFHPESIESEQGGRLVANFLGLPKQTGTGAATVAPIAKPERLALRQPTPVRWSDLDVEVSAEALFTDMYAEQPYGFWLDSSRQAYGMGRYSYLGSAASEGVQALRGYVATGLVEEMTSTGVRCFSADFFEHLRNRIAEVPVPAGSSPVPFTGGYVGYLGYGMKGAVGIGRAGSGVRPDAELMRVDRFVAFDHELGRRYLVTVGVSEAESTAWFAQVREHALRLSTSPAPAQPYPGGGLSAVSATVDQDTYLRHFDEVQRWLRDGDSYEACYTYQVTARSGEHPYPAYRRLRRQNPAPYAAYLRFGNRGVLSSSPERFVTVTGDRWVETKPIKGTAARHPDPAADAAVSAALAADEKIRSENLMITDLLRNDLGRLCDVGTVHVPHLMAVESYATVHQVVTTIRGRLRPEFDGVGCVAGLFPGGSMTGAPKKRTVELLDDLEPAERGVYSGALGFFGYDGQVDQSIIIRTIVWEDDRLCIGVGGALIVMSDPDEEYEETKLKLLALLRALDPSAESAATAKAG